MMITASVFAMQVSLPRHVMVNAWSGSNSLCVSTHFKFVGFYISPPCFYIILCLELLTNIILFAIQQSCVGYLHQ